MDEIRERKKKEALLRRFRRTKQPAVPVIRDYIPKFNLPKLDSYKGDFPESFWGNWPVNTMDDMMPPKSWIRWKDLERLASTLNYPDKERLNRTIERLKSGADIGCRGRGRIPTEGENSESAFTYGDRVTDAIRE